jgi:hypothetical protein
MKTAQWRQRKPPGSWHAEQKRGQWFAVDQRTGRRFRAVSREDAEGKCSENIVRELSGLATVPAAVIWGKL